MTIYNTPLSISQSHQLLLLKSAKYQHNNHQKTRDDKFETLMWLCLIKAIFEL